MTSGEHELVIDLFCGSGGWTDGFLAEGFKVIGYDIVEHPAYQGQFRLQDVRTLVGGTLRSPQLRVIVASPPCDEFLLGDKPYLWPGGRPPNPSLDLVEAARRIAKEAGAPLVLENVRGAQRWLGRAVGHFDSFYLWGDGVPAMLPRGQRRRWKEALPSSRPDLRARIPFELANFIARCYRHGEAARPGQSSGRRRVDA